MDPATTILVLIFGAGVVGLGLANSARLVGWMLTSSKDVERTLAALAKRRGLHCQRQDKSAIVSSSMMCFGSINGQEVRIKLGELGGIRVSVATAFDAAVDMWAKDLGGTLIAGTTDPSEAGPGYFKGPEDEVLARMNHGTRRWILDALRTNTALVAGWLVVEGPKSLDVDQLEGYLDAALSLARLLGPDDLDPQDALVASAQSDPNPAFRHRCFERLRTSAARARAATEMVQRDDPETRLLGAATDPVRWASVLIELVDGPYPADLGRRAIKAMGTENATPEVHALLVQSLADPVLRGAAAEGCRRAQAGVPYEPMRLAVEFTSPWSRGRVEAPAERARGVKGDRALAACLGSTDVAPWPQAEALLLELLEREDDSVATEAAKSLKVRGTIAAVHPLMTRSEGFTRSGTLKTAARGAIAAIQARAGDAEHGGLALTDDADKAGGVGLVDPDEA